MSPEKIVAVILLVALMLHTGLQVNRENLQAVLKNYGLLGRAFLANFILVPIYGVLIARAFHLNAAVATGVLLMAISPGVPFVVLSAGRKKGGSLGLAVSLAFLMPAISIVTVPITAHFVLPGSHVESRGIIASLFIFQLVPLLLGMFLTDRAPQAAARLQRPLGLVLLVAIILLLALLAPKIVSSIGSVYGSLRILAMLVIVLLSLVTGWLLAIDRPQYRRTLAIGTTLRNIGLAAVIATTTFAGTEVAAAVLTYFVIQFIVALLIGVVFTRMAKRSEAPA